MLTNRRDFLRTSAATGAFIGLMRPVWAMAQESDQALHAMLQRHCEAFLQRSPEEATTVDFDVGENSYLRSLLDDRSLTSRASDRVAVSEGLRELRAVSPDGLSPAAVLDRDVALYVYETLDRLLGFYGYADMNLRPSPYVVSQMNGAYYWLPDFIGSRHPIADAADADAWFARLSSLAFALDQESEQVGHDAAIGVIPPDFVIARTIAQIEGLRDRPPLESALLAPALRKLAALGREGDAERVLGIFRERVAPALTRQVDALKTIAPKAGSTAGVWHLPDGDAYYASAVQANTTTNIDPGELHTLGLDQCASLIAQIDTLLKAEGMSKGTVGERIAALNVDLRFKVSDDDLGREKLIELARSSITDITERLHHAFGVAKVEPVEVRRTPPAIEAGSPGAFYSEGGPGQPGVYSLNLQHPGELALWRLPTLTHHEAVPGHHFQFGVLSQAQSLPLFRRVVRFSAYTEGYALYAQQVAAELGIFDGQPFNRVGELQSQLFRAARIVVDTGLHYKRWSKERAIAWMVENAGEQPLATEREVTRYAVYPGQACSFKVGATRIVEAREAARLAMGPRFDIRNFHDLILTSGPMPMAVLSKTVADWAASTKSS